ncbi:hypothetical protein TrVE_jg5152 [Triparma verrucosa]|uniref:1-acyl-sn-glycerol-3-phosphate acyltransferase n=1 Tax=Triparma verrucosa TaxID=1606542 RepID=A0A9W7BCU3_9STRA|nr:hypothetical protein TrVE_jg5152 [Triparma verrucosa]
MSDRSSSSVSPPPFPAQRLVSSSDTSLKLSLGGSSSAPLEEWSKPTRFSVNLGKVGIVNLYGFYYGMTSILLGLVWTIANFFTWLSYKLCENVLRIKSFDKGRRIAVFLSHVWGVWLMRLTRCYPIIESMPSAPTPVKYFQKSPPTVSPSVMYVANHCSWMDIPYMGAAIGWRNYKIVAKKELTKVPILGQSILLGGHVCVDRTDRRSQIQTLKKGIEWLKSGVPLCAFPEGTRSKTGRLMPFKRGAFSMASKAGAEIVPLSIVGSERVMPVGWVMPKVSSRSLKAKIVVHPPISSVGKTEEELTKEVRAAIVSGLPEAQRPKDWGKEE